MNDPLQDDPSVMLLTERDPLHRLVLIIRELRSAVVAYSGGIDSTLLLYAAKQSGIPLLAVTAFSEIMPERELREAVATAGELGVPHRVIHTDELSDPVFVSNTPERCFLCKDSRFSRMKLIAQSEGYAALADGSNSDDFSEWRPGLKALRAHGVRSPLRDAGLTKNDVRALARQVGIAQWAKPSSPCLCTRIPFGSPISRERLRTIESAEDFLRSLGFEDIRVRDHDGLARIEIAHEDMYRVSERGARESVAAYLRNLGFVHVTIDLEGRRSGSLNPGTYGVMPQ